MEGFYYLSNIQQVNKNGPMTVGMTTNKEPRAPEGGVSCTNPVKLGVRTPKVAFSCTGQRCPVKPGMTDEGARHDGLFIGYDE
jgi:hypothetical protein